MTAQGHLQNKTLLIPDSLQPEFREKFQSSQTITALGFFFETTTLQKKKIAAELQSFLERT